MAYQRTTFSVALYKIVFTVLTATTNIQDNHNLCISCNWLKLLDFSDMRYISLSFPISQTLVPGAGTFAPPGLLEPPEREEDSVVFSTNCNLFQNFDFICESSISQCLSLSTICRPSSRWRRAASSICGRNEICFRKDINEMTCAIFIFIYLEVNSLLLTEIWNGIWAQNLKLHFKTSNIYKIT